MNDADEIIAELYSLTIQYVGVNDKGNYMDFEFQLEGHCELICATVKKLEIKNFNINKVINNLKYQIALKYTTGELKE